MRIAFVVMRDRQGTGMQLFYEGYSNVVADEMI